MNWAIPLLADASPCLRLLVLRDLMQRPADDPEVREMDALRPSDPLLTGLVQAQNPDGAWLGDGLSGDKLRATAQALTRLGYLGLGRDHPAVQRGAEYLFARQKADGSWPLFKSHERDEGNIDGGYDLISLQTSTPLRGLAWCGYAADPRAERAYEWLLAQRLPDGAWPTGIAAGVYGGVGGYRRLAHSRWGCRSNTTGALICLAFHPQRRTSEAARQALDHLLGRETREVHTFGYEVARLVGTEIPQGFLTFYARFDLALVLDLCSRIGASTSDPRVEDLLSFVLSLQGEYGLWEYASRPQVSRWLTLDLMRSIARLDENVGWLGMEPRTPFRSYPKRDKRY